MPEALALPRPGAGEEPPDHAALMALYEANYHCLIALCPPLRNAGAQARRYRCDSRPGLPPLELALREHTRHTATFDLGCRQVPGTAGSRLPDVQVRLYRDSRQAELLSYNGTARFFGQAPGEGSLQGAGLRCRYVGNRDLLCWLRFCLRQGYHLSSDPERSP